MKVGRSKAFCPTELAGIKVIRPRPLAGPDGVSRTWNFEETPRILRIKPLSDLKTLGQVDFDQTIKDASLADGTGRLPALLAASRIGALENFQLYGVRVSDCSEVIANLSSLGIHFSCSGIFKKATALTQNIRTSPTLSILDTSDGNVRITAISPITDEVKHLLEGAIQNSDISTLQRLIFDSQKYGITIATLVNKVLGEGVPAWLKLDNQTVLRNEEQTQLKTPPEQNAEQAVEIITRLVIGRLAGPRAYAALTPEVLIKNTLQELKDIDFKKLREILYALAGLYGGKQERTPVTTPGTTDPLRYTYMMMDTGFFIGQAAQLLFGTALFTQEALDFVTDFETINKALKSQDGKTSSQIAIYTTYAFDFFAALVLGACRENSNQLITFLQKTSERLPQFGKSAGLQATASVFINTILNQLPTIECFREQAAITTHF